jgi:DNA-binding response OmpR family regulator
MFRLLLAEDHERLGAIIVSAMREAGVKTDVFTSIASAEFALAEGVHAAAVIDRGLPDGDGLDLVRRIRSGRNPIPCLMLTARDALHDRVTGLEAGADDYLTKPFAMEELVARVRSLLRRPAQLQSLTPEFEGLRVSPDGGVMTFGGKTISLAATELQIMLALLRAGGETVRRTLMERSAWTLDEPVTPNALDVSLHRLRRKLLQIDCPVQIVTIRGHGHAVRLPAP